MSAVMYISAGTSRIVMQHTPTRSRTNLPLMERPLILPPWRRSGYKDNLAGVLVFQDALVGCCCFGEGVGPVDERFDLPLVPEQQNGLEFFPQDCDLSPQVADVDAADG